MLHILKLYITKKYMQLQKCSPFRGEKTRNPVFPQRNRGYSSTVFPREEQAVRTASRNIRMYLIILFSVSDAVSV